MRIIIIIRTMTNINQDNKNLLKEQEGLFQTNFSQKQDTNLLRSNEPLLEQ